MESAICWPWSRDFKIVPVSRHPDMATQETQLTAQATRAEYSTLFPSAFPSGLFDVGCSSLRVCQQASLPAEKHAPTGAEAKGSPQNAGERVAKFSHQWLAN
jgi:hypothetical protein